jgi:hypothetical protein
MLNIAGLAMASNDPRDIKPAEGALRPAKRVHDRRCFSECISEISPS